ncbi:hypothetical protein ACS0TY_035839 [Phlomoides rotata]
MAVAFLSNPTLHLPFLGHRLSIRGNLNGSMSCYFSYNPSTYAADTPYEGYNNFEIGPSFMINLKTRLMKKVEESPPLVKILLSFVELPPLVIIMTHMFLFGFMACWSVMTSAEAGPAFQMPKHRILSGNPKLYKGVTLHKCGRWEARIHWEKIYGSVLATGMAVLWCHAFSGSSFFASVLSQWLDIEASETQSSHKGMKTISCSWAFSVQTNLKLSWPYQFFQVTACLLGFFLLLPMLRQQMSFHFSIHSTTQGLGKKQERRNAVNQANGENK